MKRSASLLGLIVAWGAGCPSAHAASGRTVRAGSDSAAKLRAASRTRVAVVLDHDLAIGTITNKVGKDPSAGQAFTVEVTVQNNGPGESPAAQIELKTAKNSGDVAHKATQSVPPLKAKENRTVAFTGIKLDAGGYLHAARILYRGRPRSKDSQPGNGRSQIKFKVLPALSRTAKLVTSAHLKLVKVDGIDLVSYIDTPPWLSKYQAPTPGTFAMHTVHKLGIRAWVENKGTQPSKGHVLSITVKNNGKQVFSKTKTFSSVGPGKKVLQDYTIDPLEHVETVSSSGYTFTVANLEVTTTADVNDTNKETNEGNNTTTWKGKLP